MKPSPPFTPDEYVQRLKNVYGRMWERGLQLLVLTSPDSIYYLTAFQTPGDAPTALIVPRNRRMILVTRGLEGTNAKYRSTVEYDTYEEGQTPETVIATHILRLYDGLLVGYEAASPRWPVKLQQKLESICASVSWEDVSDIVLQQRVFKSEEELKFIKIAASYVTKGYQALEAPLALLATKAMEDGTELFLAGEAQRAMMHAGSEYTAYPIFVATGCNGLMAHHAASRSIVQQGDVVFFEMGACHHRYHAAKMHTAYIGANPPERFVKNTSVLQFALSVGRTACVDGAIAKDVDRAMREVCEDHLEGEYSMSQRSGYSIGASLVTDWSDKAVLIDPKSTTVLQAGMTLHIIPWIQVEGVGAMGFSDTVVVVDSGPAVSLFEAP